ncbi:unnamed protein product, partial [Symbiodinium sp. CCMP2456]
MRGGEPGCRACTDLAPSCRRAQGELASFRASPRSATTALNRLVKDKRSVEAAKLLEELIYGRVAVDEVHFRAVLFGVAAAQSWMLAVHLLAEMEQCRIPYNKGACDAAISSCRSSGKWELALGLLASLHLATLVGDAVTFSNAMGSCLRDFRWPTSLALFRSMALRQVSPDSYCCSVALSSCKGQAWRVTQLLLEDYTSANTICQNAALSAGGHWESVLGVVAGLETRQVQSDTVTFSTALACEGFADWPLALRIIDHMSAKKATPNIIAVNAALSVCEMRGEWEAALALLKEAVAERLGPSAITLNTIISACQKSDAWEEAVGLLCRMPALHLQRDSFTYNAAASACCRRQWRRSLQL